MAILGDLREEGELVAPWGVVARVCDGLIIESHSYLSEEELLEQLGLLGAPPAVS